MVCAHLANSGGPERFISPRWHRSTELNTPSCLAISITDTTLANGTSTRRKIVYCVQEKQLVTVTKLSSKGNGWRRLLYRPFHGVSVISTSKAGIYRILLSKEETSSDYFPKLFFGLSYNPDRKKKWPGSKERVDNILIQKPNQRKLMTCSLKTQFHKKSWQMCTWYTGRTMQNTLKMCSSVYVRT